jgi:hypothetical protein
MHRKPTRLPRPVSADEGITTASLESQLGVAEDLGALGGFGSAPCFAGGFPTFSRGDGDVQAFDVELANHNHQL